MERRRKTRECLGEKHCRRRSQQVQRWAGCLVYVEDDWVAWSDEDTTPSRTSLATNYSGVVLFSAFWWWYCQLGMPESLAWAHISCGKPTDISLTRADIVAGRALVVLIMIAGHTSATPTRELGRTDLLLTYPGEYTVCPNILYVYCMSHSEAGVEREREREEQDLGLCFFSVRGWCV